MNRSIAFSLLAAAAAAISLSACNGGGTTPAPAPTLGPTCALPAGTQTVLVYPAPGSTGVNDTNGQIVIGSTTALPVGQTGENWSIAIVDAVYPNGTVIPGTLQAATPPFPTPSATPSFPNPQYQTQAFGTAFAANQVVTVYVNNRASNCAPLQIGQFST